MNRKWDEKHDVSRSRGAAEDEGVNNAVFYERVDVRTHPLFRGRVMRVFAGGRGGLQGFQLPVADSIVLCNGCNANLWETESGEGYLLYLSRNAKSPYDVYCHDCLVRLFPQARPRQARDVKKGEKGGSDAQA